MHRNIMHKTTEDVVFDGGINWRSCIDENILGDIEVQIFRLVG